MKKVQTAPSRSQLTFGINDVGDGANASNRFIDTPSRSRLGYGINDIGTVETPAAGFFTRA